MCGPQFRLYVLIKPRDVHCSERALTLKFKLQIYTLVACMGCMHVLFKARHRNMALKVTVDLAGICNNRGNGCYFLFAFLHTNLLVKTGLLNTERFCFLWEQIHSLLRRHSFRKKVREKSRECHNHKPQPFPDTKRKRIQTKPNKRKSTNVRKALRLALSSPSEVITVLKGLKDTRTK